MTLVPSHVNGWQSVSGCSVSKPDNLGYCQPRLGDILSPTFAVVNHDISNPSNFKHLLKYVITVI